MIELVDHYPHVFTPLKVGPITLKNRIQWSPMVSALSTAYGEVTPEYISEKETMVVRLSERGGTKEVPVPEDQREAPVLTEDERSQLVALANKIEDFYKKPEDIEWAIVDGQVYLLQSRPITTMK